MEHKLNKIPVELAGENGQPKEGGEKIEEKKRGLKEK